MVEWRDRGFVQDSDQEDEAEISDAGSPNHNHNTRHSHKLEPVPLAEVKQLNRIWNRRTEVAVVIDFHKKSENLKNRVPRREEKPVIIEEACEGQYANIDAGHTTDKTGELISSSCKHLPVDGEWNALQADDHVQSAVETRRRAGVNTPILQFPKGKVSKCANGHAHRDMFDISSSPLSDAPASPIPSIIETPHEPQRHESLFVRSLSSSSRSLSHTPTSSVLLSRRPNSSPSLITFLSRPKTLDLHGEPLQSSEQQGNATRRTFRRRNPIQLHPYLLEHEQYRNTLRSRGVRPVTLADPYMHNVHSKDIENPAISSADRSSPFEDSSQSSLQSSPPLRLSEGEEFHSKFLSGERKSFNQLTDDLHEITGLRSTIRNLDTLTTDDGQAQKQSDGSQGCLPVRRIQNHPQLAKSRVVKKYRLKKFKMPTGFTQADLPTPDTSSEFGLHEQAIENSNNVTLLDLESDPAIQRIDSACGTMRSSSPQSINTVTPPLSPIVSDSSSDESAYIRAAQRRIRGVLPASYLTLNQGAQTQVQKKFLTKSASGSREDNIRGVARRINMGTGLHGRNPSPSMTLSWTYDGTEGKNQDSPRKHNMESTKDLSYIPSSRGSKTIVTDLIEEDWVDPMAPTKTRNKARGASHGRQPKIKEALSKSATNQNGAFGSGSIAEHDAFQPVRSVSEKEKRHRTDRAKRKHLLKFSVIDPSTLGSLNTKPDFLKIAVRQARSRGDSDRNRRSEKFISLHDWRDDTVIEPVLQERSTGSGHSRSHVCLSVAQKKTVIKSYSKPSVYQQQKLPAPIKLISLSRALLRSTRQGRINLSQVKSQIQQDLLDVQRSVLDRVSAVTTSPIDESRVDRMQTKEKTSLTGFRSSRPGQLEDLETENDNRYHDEAFQRKLVTLNKCFDAKRMHRKPTTNPLLRTLPKESSIKTRGRNRDAQIESERSRIHDVITSNLEGGRASRQTRKRLPQRINVDDFDIDFAPSPTTLPSYAHVLNTRQGVAEFNQPLHGLGKFGTFYTADFGVMCLDVGTYFHSSTFVGSGEFEKALATGQHDADQQTGLISFTIGGTHYKWGSWTDETATQLSHIFQEIQLWVEASLKSTECGKDLDFGRHPMQNIFLTMRFVMRYFSSHIHFVDVVDRIPFLERLLHFLGTISDCFNVMDTSTDSREYLELSATKPLRVRVLTYVLVMVYQSFHIAEHPIIQSNTAANVQALLQSTVCRLTKVLLTDNLHQLWSFAALTQRVLVQQSGIKDDYAEVESIVVLSHVLPRMNVRGLQFWTVFTPAFAQRSLPHSTEVAELDKTWHDIFAILPFLNFESSGVLSPRIRTELSDGQWTVVKIMLCRLFEVYPSTIGSSGSTINSYVRATLSRCFNLMRIWQWANPELVLNCLFDFFARHGLGLLQHEESKGSPGFIGNVNKTSVIELDPSDRSFDIFLKILYIGITRLCSHYSAKKLKSIAWRYIPNGGRVLEKHKELHQHDLDARRNHHDLLCVLYTALPPASRPSIDMIQDLVDFVSSHSEICRVNIRSWAKLTTFQLSTDEPAQAVNPFGDWYNKFLHALAQQHGIARIDVENQFAESKVEGGNFSAELVESTIASNQKHIESLLIMALASLGECIKDGRNIASITALFNKAHVALVLDMFDPKLVRFDGVIMVALETYDVYLERLEHFSHRSMQQPPTEDSQEFGDWSALEGIVVDCSEVDESTLMDKLAVPIQKLLSNCFGAESFFDELLLSKLTNTWLRFCHHSVRCGRRDWSYYLNQHSPGSWRLLRYTDNTRKFFPYFMARVLHVDKSIVPAHNETIINAWMLSLVDRESMLKFQGQFTTALLNICPLHPLLQNLPFVVNTYGRCAEISLDQLRTRRLETISTVLSNMRRSIEAISPGHITDVQRLRSEYASLLRHFSEALRNNYQETQQNSSTRGAYVDFVHKVVELLQQYTSNICPIDPFFTDSAAFPLPTSDPSYVVGRLKSYAYDLSASGNQKKLGIFMQSVCERAVIENQQTFLVEQIKRAVTGSREEACVNTPSLQAIMVRAILPAYLGLIFTSDCGWILANVLLEATTLLFDDLMFQFSIADTDSCNNTITMIDEFLRRGCGMVRYIIVHADLISQPHILFTLNSIYRTVTRTLCVVDYISRFSEIAVEATEHIARLVEFAEKVRGSFEDQQQSEIDAWNDTSSYLINPLFVDLEVFCKRELETSLNKNWVKCDTQYHVVRGNSRREVVIDLGTVEEEEADMMGAIGEFLRIVERLPSFTGLLQPSREFESFSGGGILFS